MTDIGKMLLEWYDANKRTLPWRGEMDPYAVWVSETMLQQTRVATVLDYYPRFMRDYPTVQALAAAEEADVLKHWEGLGYYSRARNLHKGAKQVCERFDGILPADVEQLLTISGIGAYTAGAIASIAFGLPVPAVDANVIRVVSRVVGIRENVGIPSVRKTLEQAAATLVPDERPGDFNQAMMDLGSSVCVPGTPECAACPLKTQCNAANVGDAEELPVLPRKHPPKHLQWDVLLVFSEKGVLMRQRREALLHNLWVYPMAEGHDALHHIAENAQRLTGLQAEHVRFVREAKHVFTHQVWEMRIFAMEAAAGELLPGWHWVSVGDMPTTAIPSAMKAAREIVENAWREGVMPWQEN